MRRTAIATVLFLLLATTLLATVIARAQAIAEPAEQHRWPLPPAHPAEQSDVHGLSSLPDWGLSQPLTSSPDAIPAPNDACQDPITVTLTVGDNQVAAQFGTTAATTDPNDPLQSCTIGGPAVNSSSVWWAIQVPEDGELTFSTISGNPLRYDTVVPSIRLT